MSLSIKPLVAIDRVDWLDLFQSYVTFYETELTTKQYEITWDRLMNGQEFHGLVAELDGRVVGIAHYLFHSSTWAIVNYCYLEDLFVTPESRGLGVGKALIEEVKKVAEEMGSSRLYWTTRESNKTARKLYDSVASLTDFRQYRIRLTDDSE